MSQTTYAGRHQADDATEREIREAAQLGRLDADRRIARSTDAIVEILGVPSGACDARIAEIVRAYDDALEMPLGPGGTDELTDGIAEDETAAAR